MCPLAVSIEHVAVASVQHGPVRSSSPPPTEMNPKEVKQKQKTAIVVHASRAQVRTLKRQNHNPNIFSLIEISCRISIRSLIGMENY